MTALPGPLADPLPDLYPPFGLRITAGPLTLRPLRDEDLPEYAALMHRPIFADMDSDQVFPWCDVDPDERVARSVQFQWQLRSKAGPTDWNLSFGIFHQERLIGMQDLGASHFAVRRVVGSGSWLTLDEQGKGHGTLMRQAVLVLAFDHLGAQPARMKLGPSGAPAQFPLKGSLGRMSERHAPRAGRPISRRLLFMSAIASSVAGASSCGSLRASPERTAQLFLKAYLEGDADEAN